MIEYIKFKDKFPDMYKGAHFVYFDTEFTSLLGKEFKFTDKINVIVGPNGCGKSSLLELFKFALQLTDRMYSQSSLGYYDKIDIADVVNIADIKASYGQSAFSIVQEDNSDPQDIFEFVSCVEAKNSSSGQSRIQNLRQLFKVMFDDPERLHYKVMTDFDFINYIEANMSTIDAYTMLLDEPDQNLDIDNLNQIYKILSIAKPKTQIICVLHNIALIKKLIGNPDVNFIELESGYLQKVREF